MEMSLAGESDRRQPVSQGRLFRELRWRLLRNAWNQILAQNPIRAATIFLASLLACGFVFLISYVGFQFLERDVRVVLSDELVGIIFDVLFLALGVMLLFSSSLILHGSLFSTSEAAFLLSRPVADDQVFAYKFHGAVLFSSWAFLLLAGPFLLAYGLVAQAPWYFYVLTPLFFLGFVLLPGALGGLFILLVVNFLPRYRKQIVAAGVVVLLLVGARWFYKLTHVAPKNSDEIRREEINLLLDQLTFASGTLVPSHWVGRGLRRTIRHNWPDALYNLALVWSNGLFFYLLAAAAARRLYRRGYNLISTGGDLRRRYGGAWLDQIVHAVLFFLHPRTRLLIVKDFRTFRRDPQQWAQLILFCGLMALMFFANMRRLASQDGISWIDQSRLSLLCLGATSLLLCTYTGRFVYPMLSLEGRKFWILGLLPLEREQLLWGKFAFSVAGGSLISLTLVLLSDLLLGMPLLALGLHLLAVFVVAVGLSGLSVGLGACLPNFRENDPSRIAVGFGGTLNLVLGLLYLLIVLAVMVLPWHFVTFSEQGREGGLSSPGMLLVLFGVLAGLCLGAAAVLIPLRAGIRSLRRMEF